MDIVKTLVKIAEDQGIVNCCVDDLKSGDGQGYLGNINIMKLNGKTKCGKDKELSFVIKAATTNEKVRESGVIDIFAREIKMYRFIFPEFYNFEKERGIEKPLPSVAKCYYICDKKPEILIFENLHQTGFRVWNRKLELDDKHVRVILKEYGRYHAVSFAMQDQDPKLFAQLTDDLDNVFDVFLNGTGIYDAFARKSKLALGALDPNTNIFAKYEKFLNEVDKTYRDLITSHSKHFVILHGDSWCNNQLFKYENNTNEPVEVRFVDFQFARPASPIFDLAYFLYACTSREILEHMEDYKRIYYESLSQHIKVLGSNPDTVYPFSIFEEQWNKYSVFGLISSGLLMFELLSEEDEIRGFADVTEAGGEISSAFEYDIVNISKFNERMKCVIEYFVKHNQI